MSDLVGQTIGNYRIEERLGVGGMGQVFRARHIHLDRLAALKLMHESLAQDEGFRERFRREARAVAALRHPNVVEVLDYDEHAGRAYMVMELITAGSLRSLLQRYPPGRPRPLAPLVDMVRQAADGLAYAHGRGIIHRDIKPDNLLLARDDRGVVSVKVGDFGLARMAEGSAMTASGAVMGTPAYMSPEQCQGLDLDARSDIYAVGVVLYEMTTGVLPFQARTISEAAYKHVHVAPPPPSQVAPEIPPELERIIMRCLAKQPEARYPTMEALAADLRALVAAMPAGLTLATVAPGGAPPPTPAGPSQLPTAAGQPAPPPGQAAPPGPSQAPSSAPRVQVLDERGALVREQELSRGPTTIGRQSGSGLALESEAVSRSHARIEWDGAGARVTDLGSSNGTQLGDRRLAANVTEEWRAQDLLRVGPFLLRLVPPAAPAAQPDPLLQGLLSGAGATPAMSGAGAATPPLHSSAPTVRGSSGARVLVAADPPALTLTPGSPAAMQVTISNLGSSVDHFALSVEGAPAGCAVELPPPVALLPGQQQTIVVAIRPSRSAASLAGEYTPILRARSSTQSGAEQSAALRWSVLPFVDYALTIAPRRARGRSGADYRLTIDNRGNCPLPVALRGEDDEAALRYRFADERPTVAPGASATAALRVECPSQLVGRPQPWQFHVHAAAEGAPPRSEQAELVRVPLMPAWLPPLLIVALVALCLGLAQARPVRVALGLEPTAAPTAEPSPAPGQVAVELFAASPDTIQPGESVTLSWRVADAASVEIDAVGTVPSEGSQSLRPRESVRYTLTATGADGRQAKRVIDVLVVDNAATATAHALAQPSPAPTTEPTSPPTAPPTTEPTSPPTTEPTSPPTAVPTTPAGGGTVRTRLPALTLVPIRTFVVVDPGRVRPPVGQIVPAGMTDHRIAFYDGGQMTVGRFAGDYGDQKDTTVGGWNQIVPIGAQQLFMYRAADGSGLIAQVQADGSVMPLRSITGFDTTWSQIAYAGGGRVVFYSTQSGALVLTTMRGDSYAMVATLESPGKGWTRMVAADDGTLLFYRAGDGAGLVARVATDGGYSVTQKLSGFAKGWTQIVVMPGGGLLFYDGSGGQLVSATLAGGAYAMVATLGSPGPGWTAAAALDDGTVLLYQRGSGQARFLKLSGDSYQILAEKSGFSTGWTQIVGLR